MVGHHMSTNWSKRIHAPPKSWAKPSSTGLARECTELLNALFPCVLQSSPKFSHL
jgi:hypothetical protein